MNNYQKIIRIDLICLSLSKLLGFSCGVLILDMKWVIGVFFLSFIFSVFGTFFLYSFQKYRSNHDNKLVDKPVPTKDIYFHPKLTILLTFFSGFFLFPISTQSVFYNQTTDIPFYIFPLISSFGGLFFNLLFNKNLSLYVTPRFYFNICLVFFSFLSLSLLGNKWLMLFSFFILGGMYTTLNNISIARTYSYSKTRTAEAITRYYLICCAFNLSGSFFLGFVFEHYKLQGGFSIWAGMSFIYLFVLFALDKKNKFDKQVDISKSIKYNS